MPKFIFALLHRPGEGWSASVTNQATASFMMRGGDTLYTWGVQASDHFAVIQLGMALFGYQYPGLGKVEFE